MNSLKLSLVAESIRVNRPLPWPIYDHKGDLLLGEGEIVRSSDQVARMIKLGAWYYEVPRQTAYRPALEPDASAEVSSFEVVCSLIRRLERCYSFLDVESDGECFVRSIMDLALDIQKVCHENAPAILGSVQLIADAPIHLSHALHTAVIAEVSGKRLNLNLMDRVPLLSAALTQNIGMLDVHSQLTLQRTPLTKEQEGIVRNHPRLSVEMLEQRGVRDMRWLRAVGEHHERINGKGYPLGLKENEIIIEARLLAVIDEYVAMTRPRAYRPPLNSRTALKEIYGERGVSIDEELTRLFIKAMGLFPPGSMLRLATGELAIVVDHKKSIDQPIVAILTDRENNRLEVPLFNVEIDKDDVLATLSIYDYRTLLDQMGDIWPRLTAL